MAKIKQEMFNKVFERIEMDILVGIFRPRERLIESEIMEKYQITRNATRNIFDKLMAKGFIKRIPDRGAIIADMETKDAKDLYFLRLHLENYAADLIEKNISNVNLDEVIHVNFEFKKAVKDNNFFKMMSTNISFHETIIKLSNNNIVAEVINQLRTRSIRIRHYLWQHSANIQKSVDDHEALIEALKNKNIDELKRINESHILSPFEMYLNRKDSSDF